MSSQWSFQTLRFSSAGSEVPKRRQCPGAHQGLREIQPTLTESPSFFWSIKKCTCVFSEYTRLCAYVHRCVQVCTCTHARMHVCACVWGVQAQCTDVCFSGWSLYWLHTVRRWSLVESSDQLSLGLLLVVGWGSSPRLAHLFTYATYGLVFGPSIFSPLWSLF